MSKRKIIGCYVFGWLARNRKPEIRNQLSWAINYSIIRCQGDEKNMFSVLPKKIHRFGKFWLIFTCPTIPRILLGRLVNVIIVLEMITRRRILVSSEIKVHRNLSQEMLKSNIKPHFIFFFVTLSFSKRRIYWGVGRFITCNTNLVFVWVSV